MQNLLREQRRRNEHAQRRQRKLQRRIRDGNGKSASSGRHSAAMHSPTVSHNCVRAQRRAFFRQRIDRGEQPAV